MKHPKIREQLLLIASLYDKLADITEQADRAMPQLAVDCITGRPDAM